MPVVVGLSVVTGTAALVRDTAPGPAGLVAAVLGLLALDGLVRSGAAPGWRRPWAGR